MHTGWKAQAERRRPHTQAKLRKRPPAFRPSKRRRTAAKNSNSAMRMKGLL